MNGNDHHRSEPPWYKQFWPWFIISFPAIIVVAGIAMLIVAIKTDDSRVDDVYDKTGLRLERDTSQHQQAKRLKMRAKLSWLSSTKLVLELQGEDKPSAMTLKIGHPTNATLDRIFLVQETGRSGSTVIYEVGVAEEMFSLILGSRNVTIYPVTLHDAASVVSLTSGSDLNLTRLDGDNSQLGDDALPSKKTAWMLRSRCSFVQGDSIESCYFE